MSVVQLAKTCVPAIAGGALSQSSQQLYWSVQDLPLEGHLGNYSVKRQSVQVNTTNKAWGSPD